MHTEFLYRELLENDSGSCILRERELAWDLMQLWAYYLRVKPSGSVTGVSF
jgi:hypothetical protein